MLIGFANRGKICIYGHFFKKVMVIAALLISGSLFLFLSALGTLRFPDLFTRMHAATKAGAFGVIQIMLAVGLHFSTGWVWLEALLVVLFIFITVPVASHMIARAAYFQRVNMWNTKIDQIRNRYDHHKHTLDSLPD